MKIRDLLKQAKPCWKYAATDEDGVVWFFSAKPVIGDTCWMCKINIEDCVNIHDYLDHIVDIEPFDGEWKDSLICREECGV